MKRKEFKKTIRQSLPKGWKLDKLSVREKRFAVNCSAEERFNDMLAHQQHIKAIEAATGATCSGGAQDEGSKIYKNDFSWK